jgi:hypothetical protein
MSLDDLEHALDDLDERASLRAVLSERWCREYGYCFVDEGPYGPRRWLLPVESFPIFARWFYASWWHVDTALPHRR